MTGPDPNPYAPPPDAPAAGSSERSFDDVGQIPFRGQLTRRDLTAFLQTHDHIGCGSMLMTTAGVGLILFVFALAVGGAMGLIGLGIFGWLALTLVTSLLPYRKSVFVSANPNWDSPSSGEITSRGITLRREESVSFYDWDWFGATVVGETVIGFLPAIHPHQPILISADMVPHLSDWDDLASIARRLDDEIQSSSTTESRRYDNRAIIRSRKRERSVDLRDDAIPFEGVISINDLQHLPPVLLRRNRPTRAYLLIVALGLFGAMIFIGISRMGGFAPLLPTFLFALTALGFLMFFLVRRIRSLRSAGDTIYYLRAFADEQGVTSDFGITATTVPWQSMKLSEQNEDAIALSRPDLRQFIVARRDMFPDDSSWTKFSELAKRRANR